MEKMEIYNSSRKVPEEAIKPIAGGKLKGKSDINPMWRIKKLTELFGPCGIGWKYDIVRQWEISGAAGEVMAFCNIHLYYAQDGTWSDPIPGTGGSTLVALERGSLVSSDEAYKMALTDAISVAAKALGVAADVYFEKDPTKYSSRPDAQPPVTKETIKCKTCGAVIKDTKKGGKIVTAADVAKSLNGQCPDCWRKAQGGA